MSVARVYGRSPEIAVSAALVARCVPKLAEFDRRYLI
jgi:hypothetical protein